MSTRCSIAVVQPNATMWLYRRYDGYPEMVMYSLKIVNGWIKTNRIPGHVDLVVPWMVLLGALEAPFSPAALAQRSRAAKLETATLEMPVAKKLELEPWRVGSLVIDPGPDDDIQYLYILDTESRTVQSIPTERYGAYDWALTQVREYREAQGWPDPPEVAMAYPDTESPSPDAGGFHIVPVDIMGALWFYQSSARDEDKDRQILDTFMQMLGNQTLQRSVHGASSWLILLGAAQLNHPHRSVTHMSETATVEIKFPSHPDIAQDPRAGVVEVSQGPRPTCRRLYMVDVWSAEVIPLTVPTSLAQQPQAACRWMAQAVADYHQELVREFRAQDSMRVFSNNPEFSTPPGATPSPFARGWRPPQPDGG